MTASIYSPYWYRIAGLKPRLRAHVRIDRQYQRNQLWYVLEDRSSGRQYRFTPAAYDLIGAMDGRNAMQQIWDRSTARHPEEAPTQDEALRILSMLHATDLIQCDVTPDIEELFGRFEAHQRSVATQRWLNPLAIRVSLFDPDRLLAAFTPLLRFLFSGTGFALWLLVVVAAIVLGAQHWNELCENVIDRVLTPKNLLLLSLLYPIVKLAHEFGHAAATKVWGGEVHDVGALFIALIPMPYVDCSAASMFRRAHQRAIVGAAGMMVELFLAAIALFLWLNVEPGLVRACAFNVILIAGVSTVLVNGNPLLRFDAYYILADVIGIPNLAARANRYVGYLCQRYLLGAKDTPPPILAPGERRWFVFYSVASFLYRYAVTVALIWFIAGKYFFIGVLLAIWAVAAQIALPLLRSAKFVLASPGLATKRARACATSMALVAVPAVLLFGVPVPLTTEAQGVVWAPEGSELRAGTAATVVRVWVADGANVNADDVLIEMEDPYLTAQGRLYAAQVKELEAKVNAAIDDRVESEMLKDQLASAQAEFSRIRERQAALTLRSPISGRVVIPRIQHLQGRYLNQGDLVGYVVTDAAAVVRVVVPQERIGLLRAHTPDVAVRLAARPAEILPASLRREVPGATQKLPSAALGGLGGGELATDPNDKEGVTLMRPVFQFDLELPVDARVAGIGERLHVRFDPGAEPLGTQWYRMGRQLFLGKFQL